MRRQQGETFHTDRARGAPTVAMIYYYLESFARTHFESAGRSPFFAHAQSCFLTIFVFFDRNSFCCGSWEQKVETDLDIKKKPNI